jgi:hypothetical protein
MKAIILIIIASIGMHTSNQIIMTACLLIVGFLMYKEFRIKK